MPMTPDRAKRIVAAGALTATGIAAAGDISDGRVPRITIVLGGLGATFLLAVAAEFAPSMAAGFAGVLLVGSLLSAGLPAAQLLRDVYGGTGPGVATEEATRRAARSVTDAASAAARKAK